MTDAPACCASRYDSGRAMMHRCNRARARIVCIRILHKHSLTTTARKMYAVSCGPARDTSFSISAPPNGTAILFRRFPQIDPFQHSSSQSSMLFSTSSTSLSRICVDQRGQIQSIFAGHWIQYIYIELYNSRQSSNFEFNIGPNTSNTSFAEGWRILFRNLLLASRFPALKLNLFFETAIGKHEDRR